MPSLEEKNKQLCQKCARKVMGGMIFHVQGGGDSSVGIPDTDSCVMFIDNITWDDDAISDMKTILANFYDVYEGCVKTDEEYDKELEFERQMETELATQSKPD